MPAPSAARPAPLYRSAADLAAQLARARHAAVVEIAATNAVEAKIAALVGRLKARATAQD